MDPRPVTRDPASQSVIETARLRLRRLGPDDAAFIRELLNEPPFLANIGDKGVRTLEDAVAYIATGPAASYERFGFGLYLVEIRDPVEPEPIGICGLLKRDWLEDPDIGFALLERFWSKGYGIEAAAAVLEYAKSVCGLRRVLAVTAPDNRGSIAVLERLGFWFEGMVRAPGSEAESRLFSCEPA